jgi:hypothetical protein
MTSRLVGANLDPPLRGEVGSLLAMQSVVQCDPGEGLVNDLAMLRTMKIAD